MAVGLALVGVPTMFFTFCGRLVAVLAIVIGVLGIAIGFFVAGLDGAAYQEALARYLPTSSSSGEAIDKGIYRLIFGIALGTLTEISYTLRRIGNTGGVSPLPRTPA